LFQHLQPRLRFATQSQLIPSSPTSYDATPANDDLFGKTLQELKDLETKQLQESKPKRSGHFLTDRGVRIREPDEAWAVIKRIKTSVKKMNIVANMIRGLSYKRAVIQMKLCKKKVAITLLKGLQSARYNAENNHGLDPERLLVAEIMIGKDGSGSGARKSIRYHSRGRAGIRVHPRTRFTVVLKQVAADDKRLYNSRENRARDQIEYQEKREQEREQLRLEREHERIEIEARRAERKLQRKYYWEQWDDDNLPPGATPTGPPKAEMNL